MSRVFGFFLACLIALSLTSVSQATDLSIPNTYTSGSPYLGPVVVTDTGVTSGGTPNVIENSGTVTTIENKGVVFDAAINNQAILNDPGATITTLTNSGSINEFATSGSNAIYNAGTITTLNNSGSISNNTNSDTIVNFGTITTLNNSGSINSGTGSDSIRNLGFITTLNNSGTINNSDFAGVWNFSGGTITTLNNSGSINSGSGSGILNDATIATLNNSGSINSGSGSGILNNGTIATLNNAQGGNSATPLMTALTLNGNLPTNYNIIINSPSYYGQLNGTSGVSGTTTFGISSLSGKITLPLYANVISGVSSANFSNYQAAGTAWGTYLGAKWELLSETATPINWDLVFLSLPIYGPSAADTQASLAQSALALRGVYDLQNVSLINNLDSDCTLFDMHGICTSVRGSQTYLSGGIDNNITSGTLTVAYHVNNNIRIGAYLDQNLNTYNNAGVHLNNGSPAFGAFAVWNANADRLGAQVRVAVGYADKDLTVTRQVIGTSEAGTGTTSLNSYGASAVASYAMAMSGNIIFSPYAGIRYTRVSAGGYTEATSTNVTTPLTFGALTQSATTAVIGAKWVKPISSKAVAYASLGLEQDLSNNGGSYNATGVAGLTPIAFNTNINHTRPAASIGSYFNLSARERIAATLVWSKEAFTTENATSLMLTYNAGF